ncbi:hypothetical protein CJF30_00008738 [Rutstroemia sp. NJR-2017a BBW]|nr:hypothetical protein CJF30_00008738 [Rutstroemia sp. NJR-2017a BBW]
MHTCHESRSEGSPTYQLRTFASSSRKNSKDCGIWYHPSIDVLFFGGFACMATIESFCARRYDVKRVAFLIKGTTKGCCGREADLMPAGTTRRMGTAGYANVMQILHGASEEINLERRNKGLDEFPGAQCVTDVYFVVKTELMPLAWHEYHDSRYEINDSVTLRPTHQGGFTNEQKSVHSRLELASIIVRQDGEVPGTESSGQSFILYLWRRSPDLSGDIMR